MTAPGRVHDVVAPLVADRDLELYDLAHGGGILKVVVRRSGGIDLDAIAELTRAISRALDEEDPIPGSYTLEVTTPGLERPLRTAQHFAGATGEEVRLKLTPEAGDERRVEGTVASADPDAVTVRLAGGGERRVPYAAIERARTVFEWGPGARQTTNQRKSKP